MTPLQEALAPRSDQLNADDLIAGPRNITITEARVLDAGREGKKIVVRFEGDNGKPWKPCKTMGRAMVMVWGITDEAQFTGKSLTLYRDPEVSFGDQGKIGGIRISHMSDIDGPKTVKLTVSRGKKETFVFKPLASPKLAAKQTPEEWLENYLDSINAATTLDELADVQTKASRALSKLEKDHPNLHARAVNAGKDRADALTPNEGRAPEQMGEQTEEDPF